MKIKSKKPSKQRKSLFNVKNHQVSALFTAPLDETLQEEYGVKRMPIRKDDSVRVVAGEFDGIEGKVLSMNKLTRKLTIEECALQKKDGKNYNVPISVSKVILTKFASKKNKIDPWREKIIDRKEKLEELEQSPKKGKGKGGK
jgi:large subunit ribosomal protein L24